MIKCAVLTSRKKRDEQGEKNRVSSPNTRRTRANSWESLHPHTHSHPLSPPTLICVQFQKKKTRVSSRNTRRANSPRFPASRDPINITASVVGPPVWLMHSRIWFFCKQFNVNVSIFVFKSCCMRTCWFSIHQTTNTCLFQKNWLKNSTKMACLHYINVGSHLM